MNLNLAYNSVGFYHLTKLACIPVTIVIEWALYGKTVPTPVLLTLIPITIGVGFATVNDVQVGSSSRRRRVHPSPFTLGHDGLFSTTTTTATTNNNNNYYYYYYYHYRHQ